MTKSDNEKQAVSGEVGHRYFHQMLNIDDDDLDPFEYRLMGHYVRLAGQGGLVPPETLEETAKVTRMSINKLRETRNSLVDRGYLEVKTPDASARAKGQCAEVRVIDRWLENIQRFSPKPPSKITEPKAQSDMIELQGKADSKFTEPNTESFINKDSTDQEKNDSAPQNGAGSSPEKPVEPASSVPNLQLVPKNPKPADPPAKPEPPKPEKAPKPRNLLFDAVAKDFFDITSDEQLKQMDAEEQAASRIGMIAAWLGHKNDRFTLGNSRKKVVVGYISAEAKPEHVVLFAQYCREKNITPPRDVGKFVEHWRAWASALAAKANGQRSKDMGHLDGVKYYD